MLEARNEPCKHALLFTTWVNDLLAYLQEEPTRSRLYIAQKQLQDKYFELRSLVPAEHRDLVTDTYHRCIWHVYRDTYQRLKDYEIRHLDPVLDELDKKKPTFITLGDIIGKEEPDDRQTAKPAH